MTQDNPPSPEQVTHELLREQNALLRKIERCVGGIVICVALIAIITVKWALEF